MKYPSDKISSYFYREKKLLAVVTFSGLIYNTFLVAMPWFEGQLVQYLCDVLGGSRTTAEVLTLALLYVAVVLMVQFMRFVKRLYVRKFANQIGKQMKMTIYRNLLWLNLSAKERETTGTLMTKAISDADACAEGMRKVTTEVFDTGVIMVSYLAMMFYLDARMTCLAILFPPLAYFCADRLKGKVTESVARSKESAGRLNASTLELVRNTITYRVFGLEENRRRRFEGDLQDYETRQIGANIWESALPPVYLIISMAGTILILWFGAKNVLQTGWRVWNIALFSTYLSCYAKLATKASKSAKLFNAIQKASVSWKRVLPYLKDRTEQPEKALPGAELEVKDLSFAYPGQKPLWQHLNFCVQPGQILGVTGAVACGKTTLGLLLLNEETGTGTITLGGRNLSELWKDLYVPVGYQGHQPELIAGTIRDNICLGLDGDIGPVLRCVCLDKEVAAMEHGEDTPVGEGGIRLSGGQQARLALARTLYHKKPVYVLDDPFSAVDKETEREIFARMKEWTGDSAVLLISHRLTMFPETSGVLWLDGDRSRCDTHQNLYDSVEEYRTLFDLQKGGGSQ